jgi:hypothetical protein
MMYVADVHHEQRSGRASLISDNHLQKTEGENRANWCGTIRELHHIIPEVSKTTNIEAMTEKLWYRKLCTSWVTKILTDNQTMKGMGSALKFLTCVTHEGDEFLDCIPTGDETCDFNHTPESKLQSLHWRHMHDVVQWAGGRLL